MKIAGLISRFENKEFGNEPKSSSSEHSDQDGNNKEKRDKFRSSPPRASSPGRLNIRKAIKNLRAPRSPGTLKNFEKGDLEEPEAPPLTVDDRVDNVIKSIVSRRSSIEDTKNSDEDTSTNETEETNDAGNRREYLISEHSNRTLVVDNKKNKSQTSVLPDTPWSSRNLAGSSRPEYTSYENSKHERKRSYTIKQKTEEQPEQQHNHEAEYGTLALKHDDAVIKEEPEEDLPPEVVAMEKKKLKTKSKSLPSPKKSRSMDDVLKRKKERNFSSRQIGNSGSGENGDSQRGRRRLSPGSLFRRRGSNEKSEAKPKDITVNPQEDCSTRATPIRSFSAGNLRMARSKAKTIRERKARSQSPGDEKGGARKIRPGRKKSERDIFVTREAEKDTTRGEDSVTVSAHSDNTEMAESSGQPRPPRRIRGRSPADDGKGSIRIDNHDKPDDQEPSERPSLNRLPSRSRSPGTIRRSIDMSGGVSRDSSPGALSRGRSPGALRKSMDEGGTYASPGALGRGRSPGALRKSIDTSGEGGTDASRGALRGRSPGALRKSIEVPGEVGRDASLGASSRSNPSGIRAKSPCTLVRMSSTRKARSPGRYSSLHKGSGHSNGSQPDSPGTRSGASERRSPGPLRRSNHSMRTRSPGALSTIKRTKSPVPPVATEGADIVVEPPSHLQPKSDAAVTEESTAAEGDGLQPDDDLAKKNLSVPRSKSPGALARRPSKNPKAFQTQKAQSLFEQKSPSAMMMSPRRRLSKDDGSIPSDAERRTTLLSFDEAEASPFTEYRPPDTLSGGDGED